MEVEDGDLVAAAIMAMQTADKDQTENDSASNSSLLRVVTEADIRDECPVVVVASGGQNQTVVVGGSVEADIDGSGGGEIILHEQLHLHNYSHGQQVQLHHHHKQTSSTRHVADENAVFDGVILNVELQTNNVETPPVIDHDELDEKAADCSSDNPQQFLNKPIIPLDVAQELNQVDITSIDENVLKLTKMYLSDVKEVDKDYLRGFHKGPAVNFEEFLSRYFCVTGTSFVAVSNRSRKVPSTGLQRQSRYYGNCEGRIRWEAKGGFLPIEFCGYPFKIESSMYMHCLHGPKRDLRPKQPRPPKVSRRGRPRGNVCKKLECPAAIQVREISVYLNEAYFVDKEAYKNRSKLRSEKQRILKKIRNEEGKGMEVTTMRRLYIKIPYVRIHSSLHPVGENASVNQTMDYRVSQKMKQLIANNVTNINDIKKCLKLFVDDVLFKHNPIEKKPKPGNRRFYPSPVDLQRQVASALSNNATDSTDVLAEKVKEWRAKGNGHFFYRSHKVDPEESFLFVHQDQWQQRLLERYGSDLVMLDGATSNSNRVLATPMYCLCIHTNVNYIVVAVFLVEKETTANIAEALSIIHGWNTWWNPSSFLVDKCNVEMAAVRTEWPNVRLYISDYHRRQTIARWIGRKESGLNPDEQKFVMAQMDRIATEQNNTLYNSAKRDFLGSQIVIEQEEFCSYLLSEWFTCPEQWAHSFRDYAIDNLINVNNGNVTMERFLRFPTMPKTREKSAVGIATLIIESYIPDSFNKYRKKNGIWKYTKYPAAVQNVPDYLRDRPIHFVRECLENQQEADSFSSVDVQLMDATHGVFHVRSNKSFHITTFLGPSCTCSTWKTTRFPCKHFFAIFKYFYNWGFQQLPELYSSSVFLTRDVEVFQDPGAGSVFPDYTPLEVQVTIPGTEPGTSETVVTSEGASFNPSIPHPVNLISIPETDNKNSTDVSDEEPQLGGKHQNLLNIFKRGMDLIGDIADPELISETEEVLLHMVTKLQRRAIHEHYMQSALPSAKRLKPNPPEPMPPLQQETDFQQDTSQQHESVNIECVNPSYW